MIIDEQHKDAFAEEAVKNMWDGFFPAVEEMRERQKEYFRTKAPSALHAAKKCEARVDAFIRVKHAEEARKLQPEIF